MSSPKSSILTTRVLCLAAASMVVVGLSPTTSHAEGGATGICQTWNGREYVTAPCSSDSAPSGRSGGSYSGGGPGGAAAGALYGGFHSLGYAFGQWLFGGDGGNPNAAAQRQAMMEELRRRQEEAERQRREAEARRLSEIYNRLAGSLKLSGSPVLQLKGGASVPSGLKLKVEKNGGGGVAGLPGMYLDGGETPYGVQGLPGIYTGGPGQGSGLTASGLQLKTGDGSAVATQTAVAGSAHLPPHAPAFDPAAMTPQQLADVAEMFSRLPPEEQARLIAISQQGPGSPAPGITPPAVPGLSRQLPGNAPLSLQQQSGASQAATATPASALEEGSYRSQAGFDRPLGSAPPVQLNTSGPVPSILPPDGGIDADAEALKARGLR